MVGWTGLSPLILDSHRSSQLNDPWATLSYVFVTSEDAGLHRAAKKGKIDMKKWRCRIGTVGQPRGVLWVHVESGCQDLPSLSSMSRASRQPERPESHWDSEGLSIKCAGQYLHWAWKLQGQEKLMSCGTVSWDLWLQEGYPFFCPARKSVGSSSVPRI